LSGCAIFLKNARVRGCGFSKNRDRVAEDFRKSVIGLLSIFKNTRSHNSGFSKNHGPAAKDFV